MQLSGMIETHSHIASAPFKSLLASYERSCVHHERCHLTYALVVPCGLFKRRCEAYLTTAWLAGGRRDVPGGTGAPFSYQAVWMFSNSHMTQVGRRCSGDDQRRCARRHLSL
jgi:hypothetical protein